jgi:hypothetical protein
MYRYRYNSPAIGEDRATLGNDPSASIATALSGIPAGPKGPWRPDYAERGG